jgi:uncharacterized membrane protein/glutaredoxin
MCSREARIMSDRAQRRRAAPSPQLPPPRPALTTFVLALAGAAIGGYLTWTKLSGTPALFCERAGSCDIVQSSAHATFLGLPTALWGVALYLAIAALALRGFTPNRWLAALVAAAAGVGFSLYLTAISLFKLKAACPYCLASAVIVILILADVVRQRRAAAARGPVLGAAGMLGAGAGAAAVTALAAMVIYAGAPPEATPYQLALARHLAATKAVMYGAYWCPHCQEQKHLFGSAGGLLPYVECDSKGTNPRPDLCEFAQVRSFPTWVIGGQRVTGTQSLEELARLSRFPG